MLHPALYITERLICRPQSAGLQATARAYRKKAAEQLFRPGYGGRAASIAAVCMMMYTIPVPPISIAARQMYHPYRSVKVSIVFISCRFRQQPAACMAGLRAAVLCADALWQLHPLRLRKEPMCAHTSPYHTPKSAERPGTKLRAKPYCGITGLLLLCYIFAGRLSAGEKCHSSAQKHKLREKGPWNFVVAKIT